MPVKQVADIRNALTFLLTVSGVDAGRIGLWGTSFGGANAITVAALDKRIKALVVQLTFGDGERVVTGSLSSAEKEKLLQTLNKVWTRSVTQNKNMMMGLTQILTDADSKAFFEKVIVENPKINIKIPFTFVRHSMEYRPENSLKDVKIPILIVGAEKDIVNPPGESNMLYEKANEPKALYMVKGATHFEVYEGEKFAEVFGQELEWYNKYL